MANIDNNPKAIQDVFYLDTIGDHMERHYIDLYSFQNEKKEEQNEELTDDFGQGYLSHVNLFNSHDPNY